MDLPDGYIEIVENGGSYIVEEFVLMINGRGILSERPFPTRGGEVCAWVMLEENTLEKVYMVDKEFVINQPAYGLFKVVYFKYNPELTNIHWYPINETA